MPHVPSMPPAVRFFARLERFECECPSCGQLIFSRFDDRRAPKRLHKISQRRSEAKRDPHSRAVEDLVWNPHSHRLACPKCHKAFIVGLVAYSTRHGMWRLRTAPPDTVPTAKQYQEIRQRYAAARLLAGGYWMRRPQLTRAESVNLAIDQPCICPPEGVPLSSCPIHGACCEVPIEAKPAADEGSNG